MRNSGDLRNTTCHLPVCLRSLSSSTIFLIINIPLTYFKKLPFLVTSSYSITQNRWKQPEKGKKSFQFHDSQKTNNPKIASKAKWPNLSDPRQLETRLRICDDVGMRRVGQVVGGWWVSTGQLDIFRQASLNLEQISEVYWRRELWADRRQRPTIKIQPLKWFSNSPVLSANIFVKNNCFEYIPLRKPDYVKIWNNAEVWLCVIKEATLETLNYFGPNYFGLLTQLLQLLFEAGMPTSLQHA